MISRCFGFESQCPFLQDSEHGSNLNREVDSLGSIHSIPSVSVSTGSRSSSVNSMQEVMDESSSELVMMQEDDGTVNSGSSMVHKKVGITGPSQARVRWPQQSQVRTCCFQEGGFPLCNQSRG